MTGLVPTELVNQNQTITKEVFHDHLDLLKKAVEENRSFLIIT